MVSLTGLKTGTCSSSSSSRGRGGNRLERERIVGVFQQNLRAYLLILDQSIREMKAHVGDR